MKLRKSDAYLIISSAYLGTDSDILNVYRQVAKFYKAKVIHLGPTVSQSELVKFQRLKKDSEAIEMRIDALEGGNLLRAESALDDKSGQIDEFKLLERARVMELIKNFGEVKFVTTPDLCISSNFADDYSSKAEHIQDGIELSKYLFLSPIPPSGERTTRTPVTNISMDFLKACGRSWIVPHPVPMIEVYPKPGLNEAYNYYTVGSLKHSERPTNTRNQYKFAHMPCAVLVVVDKQNSEFHAKQLHIDYLTGKDTVTTMKSEPIVLDDGLCFSEKGWKEVTSEDKGTLSTDDHAPYSHPGVIGALRCLNAKHKPATFINNGDAADFEAANHHAENRPGDMEGKRIVDDLAYLRKLLDAQTFSPYIKHKVLIDSNHHEWLSTLVAKNPSLKGMLDWKTLARTHFSDWKVLIRDAGEPEIYFFGDIAIRHGDQEGGIKDGNRKFAKYICGHWHRYATYKRAIQVGCGCLLGPKYAAGRVNAWQNQVTTLTKFNGVAAANAKVVLHDKERKVSRIAYRNEIWEVDHYDLFEKKAA